MALFPLWVRNSDREFPLLTLTGKQMAMFPLEPMYSKVLILSHEWECSQEVLAIVAMCSTENLFFQPSSALTEEREQQLAARVRDTPLSSHLIRTSLSKCSRPPTATI